MSLIQWLGAALANMGPLQCFNAAIAIGGALVGFGALHRMSPKTECTIILAFALTSIGLVAQAVSGFMHTAWQEPFDTLVFGGITALMIGTRRQTLWLQPALMPRISFAVSILTIVAFLTGIEL